MNPKHNIFSNPQRLNLTETERALWLPSLLRALTGHPTYVGQVLLGIEGKPWRAEDRREIELMLVKNSEDRRQLAGHLSVLHEAARLWSAEVRKRVSLPRFLAHKRNFDNPFSDDYAHAKSVRKAWSDELSNWIDRLRSDRSGAEMSDLRVASLLISSIIYGQAFGSPLFIAMIRAIPERKRRTFVLGRIHVELSLSRKGLADAEHRIWLPDPLTATLWSTLEDGDEQQLLTPEIRDGQPNPPSDAVVWRRAGKLIGRLRKARDERLLTGIEELRLCAREVALGECTPTFVAYNTADLHSVSLSRSDAARLFPGEPLLEFESFSDRAVNRECSGDTVPRSPQPEWVNILGRAAQSDLAKTRLEKIAADVSLPAGMRLIADFGTAMASRTSRPGSHSSARTIASTVMLLAESLGTILEEQDFAAIPPDQRSSIYLETIRRQLTAVRQDMVQAIREFDLHLVAIHTTTLPVPRNSLPYFPKPESVDPNLLTPGEYSALLDLFESDWPARSGERAWKLARLLVVLSFRAGLRRGELRRLRMEDILILGCPWLYVRRRKNDPLKTPNAQRRLPIGVLLAPNELEELRNWITRRTQEGARATDYVFANPAGKRISGSLFDCLNRFMRRATYYANGGKGIHLHHCRHAFGAWIFTALLMPSPERRVLFPALRDPRSWLPSQESLRLAINRHTKPSKKVPFQIARLCGHSSFDTTASSYIHICPWLVAHEADKTESLKPDPELVRKASKAKAEESKVWLREGGVHNIPVRLLVAHGKSAGTELVRQDTTGPGFSARSNSESDWVMRAWMQLMRHSSGELMSQRARWLSTLTNSAGSPRHPLEKQADLSGVTNSQQVAVPLNPPHVRNAVSPNLQNLIATMATDHRVTLLIDAVLLFALHHERDGWVRFDSVSFLSSADRYIEFLRQLGFAKRELDLISGDPDEASEYRRLWRDDLSETYLVIRPCPAGRNYGPKTSLWARPKPQALARRNTGLAGFRFLMAMAFIVFGVIPGNQKIANADGN